MPRTTASLRARWLFGAVTAENAQWASSIAPVSSGGQSTLGGLIVQAGPRYFSVGTPVPGASRVGWYEFHHARCVGAQYHSSQRGHVCTPVGFSAVGVTGLDDLE